MFLISSNTAKVVITKYMTCVTVTFEILIWFYSYPYWIIAITFEKILFYNSITTPPQIEKNDRQSDCGEGWIDNTRSSCFHFLVGLLTWDAAESHCQEMGAHLMSIDDPTEQAFIAGEIMRLSDFPGYTCSLKCSAWDIYFYKLIKARQVFVHSMRFISVCLQSIECKYFNLLHCFLGARVLFSAGLALFIWLGFYAQLKNYTLIWKHHHCRYMTSNFDLYSTFMAIEQWGFFSVARGIRL